MRWKTFLRDRSGASAAEYVLILAAVGGALTVGVALLGTSVSGGLGGSGQAIDRYAANFSGSGGTATPPADAGSPPPAGDTSPGNSGNAPGHGGTSPGNSGDAPGHGGTSPGNSGDAPGKNK